MKFSSKAEGYRMTYSDPLNAKQDNDRAMVAIIGRPLSTSEKSRREMNASQSREYLGGPYLAEICKHEQACEGQKNGNHSEMGEEEADGSTARSIGHRKQVNEDGRTK